MKKNIIMIVVSILIIFITLIIFGCVDYTKYKNNEEPIFCFIKNKLEDGGTKEYIGVGYKIIYFHRIEGVSSYYGGSHFVPIWKDVDELYKEARGTFSELSHVEQISYDILLKFHDKDELERILTEWNEYEKRIKEEYIIVKREFLGIFGAEYISYKPGYASVKMSKAEEKWFDMCLDAYYSEETDEYEKMILENALKNCYRPQRIESGEFKERIRAFMGK